MPQDTQGTHMTDTREEAHPLAVACADTMGTGLQSLDQGALETQFTDLIATLDAARAANDEQRCLLLDLRSRKLELEIQGRELRATQRALEVSRDHYARLFDQAPVGYVVLDRAGAIRAVNLTAASLLGQSRTEIEGTWFERFVIDSEAEAFRDHLAAVFARADPTSVVCDLVLHLRETPQPRVVRLCSVRRDALGDQECFTTLFDITAEHEAERQRRAGDRLRQSVLDALPSQIAVLDSSGRIIAVNRVWREFALENPELNALRNPVGADYLEVCRLVEAEAAGEVPAIAQRILDVIRRRSPGFAMDCSFHSADQHRWFLMRVVPLDGEVEGAVVAYLDVTERRQAEADARRARDALAQVARLNAVGILASSLIHELLQPLSAASFFCSAANQLAEGPAANVTRLIDVIGRIDDQVHRAGDIMERLRTFLRGREMHKVMIPLGELLGRAFDLVQWFAADHKVQLRLAAPPDLPAILTDPVQIEQVLVNLICNAVQAIERFGALRREVLVEVRVAGVEVELIVSDTGPGLPSDRREALFDIFESTTDSSLGLGLAISRAIAEAHGGRLWAEPEPPVGAVFHFTLPLDAVGQTDEPASTNRP